MSETWIGVADLRSACPGFACTMRAASENVIALSLPLSRVTTTVPPETDFTVPITLAAGACPNTAGGTMHPIRAAETAASVRSLAARRLGIKVLPIEPCAGWGGRKELSNPGKYNLDEWLPGCRGKCLHKLAAAGSASGFSWLRFHGEQRLLSLHAPAVSTEFAVGAK